MPAVRCTVIAPVRHRIARGAPVRPQRSAYQRAPGLLPTAPL